ncbi:MAG: hypothetical protein KQH63_15275 [Desulfobulbaceae bacterium]|nr:hypothetical protein [Desulfobulbaceae bacterium]
MFHPALSLALSLVVLFSFTPASVSAASDCTTIITERCETCHYKTRICRKLGVKSKGQWKRTVKNMVHYGAELNKDEMKMLVTCLDTQDKSIVNLCEQDE